MLLFIKFKHIKYLKNNIYILIYLMLFDIVIPVGPNDLDIIKKQIPYTKKNIIGYRNIFLISCDTSLQIDDCITIFEDIFPFTIDTVAKYHGKINRNGWYLQQLFKLYAGLIIPNIADKYLVIDSDTFFLKPVSFIENGKCTYNFGTEYHKPYFEHMQNLHNNFTKQIHNMSGICHHMMFETKYINEIINIVERQHNDFFYNIFLKLVKDVQGSGASEYELYFNYILRNHSESILIRKLNWKNVNNLNNIDDYEYVSYHWYMR